MTELETVEQELNAALQELLAAEQELQKWQQHIWGKRGVVDYLTRRRETLLVAAAQQPAPEPTQTKRTPRGRQRDAKPVEQPAPDAATLAQVNSVLQDDLDAHNAEIAKLLDATDETPVMQSAAQHRRQSRRPVPGVIG